MNTPDYSDNGYFVFVDLKSSNELKQRTINFPFCIENKVNPQDKFAK